MLLIDNYRALAKYNAWMNAKILARCGELSDAQLRQDMGAYFKSIHGTLNHLVLSDKAWMMRFTGDKTRFNFTNDAGQEVRIKSLDQILHEDFAALRRERARLDEAIVLWTLALEPADMEKNLRWYSMSSKQEFDQPIWQCITHFFNHHTHHRGQLSSLLTRHDQHIGITDLGIWAAQGMDPKL